MDICKFSATFIILNMRAANVNINTPTEKVKKKIEKTSEKVSEDFCRIC